MLAIFCPSCPCYSLHFHHHTLPHCVPPSNFKNSEGISKVTCTRLFLFFPSGGQDRGVGMRGLPLPFLPHPRNVWYLRSMMQIYNSSGGICG